VIWSIFLERRISNHMRPARALPRLRKTKLQGEVETVPHGSEVSAQIAADDEGKHGSFK
jgi:hypothetical protein